LANIQEDGHQACDELVEKTAYDAFYKTSLTERLQLLETQQLVITGMQTEYCVDADGICRATMSQTFDSKSLADGTAAKSKLDALFSRDGEKEKGDENHLAMH
tara:strand:+ start:91 stop:399 length:309 start_codon:yes stop_codon:yes gene_type:complete